MWVPPDALRHNLRILGGTGLGKTLFMAALERSIARYMEWNPKEDTLVVKWLPKPSRTNPSAFYPATVPVINVDPFIKGGTMLRLLIARTPSEIRQQWDNMIQPGSHHDDHWRKKAIDIAALLNMAYEESVPGEYGLRDLVWPSFDVKDLRRVCRAHRRCRGLLAEVNSGQYGMSLVSSLSEHTRRLEVLAALDHSSTGPRIDVPRFLRYRRAVLELPYRDREMESLHPLLRLALIQLEQHFLAQARPGRFLFCLFDEMGQMKNIKLDNFAIKAREYGGCIVEAHQSPSQCEHAHGKEYWKSFQSQFKWTVVFRIEDTDDAEYAARLLLKTERLPEKVDDGFNPMCYPPETMMVPVGGHITANTIKNLPVPSPGHPFVTGFLRTPYSSQVFLFKTKVTWFLKFMANSPPRHHIERPTCDQELRPWGTPDYRRLGL